MEIFFFNFIKIAFFLPKIPYILLFISLFYGKKNCSLNSFTYISFLSFKLKKKNNNLL